MRILNNKKMFTGGTDPLNHPDKAFRILADRLRNPD